MEHNSRIEVHHSSTNFRSLTSDILDSILESGYYRAKSSVHERRLFCMNPVSHPSLINAVTEVLSEDRRVIFAYLYGSFPKLQDGNDIDLAIYALEAAEPHGLSADLKIALHKKTGLPPETFDIRIINDLAKKGDAFGLLYLRNVLDSDMLLADKDSSVRADFLEQYGSRFKECEGLMQELVG
jgi:predicted nucleotidyltransferase